MLPVSSTFWCAVNIFLHMESYNILDSWSCLGDPHSVVWELIFQYVLGFSLLWGTQKASLLIALNGFSDSNMKSAQAIFLRQPYLKPACLSCPSNIGKQGTINVTVPEISSCNPFCYLCIFHKQLPHVEAELVLFSVLDRSTRLEKILISMFTLPTVVGLFTVLY